MNYAAIKTCDIANGPGVRVTLFVSGCTNACDECFQPETWDFDYGDPFDDAPKERIMTELSHPYVRGLTLLGGDPFEPDNQRALLPFLKEVRAEHPDKDIWAFTGFTWENLKKDGSYCRTEVTDEMISLIDVVVDGPYMKELYSITLRFRGSSNQRLIDVKKTAEAGEIVIWDDGSSHTI